MPDDSLPRAKSSAVGRLIGAVTVAGLLVAGTVCDLTVVGFRSWGDHHEVTVSAVSSLLVVGVTALIFDEVVSRRERRDRAATVAAQALIVYGQAERAYQQVTAKGGAEETNSAGDELQSLGQMLLVASPVLFEDPEARVFLGAVERFVGSIYRARANDGGTPEGLEAAWARVGAALEPLALRIRAVDRAAFDSSQ